MSVVVRTGRIWVESKDIWSRSYGSDRGLRALMPHYLEARPTRRQGDRTKQGAASTTPAICRLLDIVLEHNIQDTRRRHQSRLTKAMFRLAGRVQRPALNRLVVCWAQSGHQAVVAVSCSILNDMLKWGSTQLHTPCRALG